MGRLNVFLLQSLIGCFDWHCVCMVLVLLESISPDVSSRVVWGVSDAELPLLFAGIWKSSFSRVGTVELQELRKVYLGEVFE
ncbi:hypothetical protein KC19_7G079500 [Ceratodon purpureus]|uniref:Secreted protein n=1 Tax=Ceratodon purpureus TaxID=3225 RepID=A0A8T0H419_CERPU|nr:hypothetical protein KC19_7G079500 [Ceratodon purpureus]